MPYNASKAGNYMIGQAHTDHLTLLSFSFSCKTHGFQFGHRMGVRVNVLRQAHCYLPATLMLMHLSASPGYMLTKLTKTILEHDQDLKVQICLFM